MQGEPARTPSAHPLPALNQRRESRQGMAAMRQARVIKRCLTGIVVEQGFCGRHSSERDTHSPKLPLSRIVRSTSGSAERLTGFPPISSLCQFLSR